MVQSYNQDLLEELLGTWGLKHLSTFVYDGPVPRDQGVVFGRGDILSSVGRRSHIAHFGTTRRWYCGERDIGEGGAGDVGGCLCCVSEKIGRVTDTYARWGLGFGWQEGGWRGGPEEGNMCSSVLKGEGEGECVTLRYKGIEMDVLLPSGHRLIEHCVTFLSLSSPLPSPRPRRVLSSCSGSTHGKIRYSPVR
jgi:hypothetical protein